MNTIGMRSLVFFSLILSVSCFGTDWKSLADKLTREDSDAWPAVLKTLTEKNLKEPTNGPELYYYRWVLRQVAAAVRTKPNVRKRAKAILKRLKSSSHADVHLLRFRTAMAIREKEPVLAEQMLRRSLRGYQKFGRQRHSLEKSAISLALLEQELSDGRAQPSELKERLNKYVKQAIHVFVEPDGRHMHLDDSDLFDELDSKKMRLIEFLESAEKLGGNLKNYRLVGELLKRIKEVKSFHSLNQETRLSFDSPQPTNSAGSEDEFFKSWVRWVDAMIKLGRPKLAENLVQILTNNGKTVIGTYELWGKQVEALLALNKRPQARLEIERIRRKLERTEPLQPADRFRVFSRLFQLSLAAANQAQAKDIAEEALEYVRTASKRDPDFLKEHGLAVANLYDRLAKTYEALEEKTKAVVAMRQSLNITRRYFPKRSQLERSRSGQLSRLKKQLNLWARCTDLFGAIREVPIVY